MRTDVLRSGRARTTFTAALLLVPGLALGACQGGSVSATSTSKGATSSPTTTPVPTETPTGTATRPPDAVVTTLPTVKRPGAKPAAQRVKANKASFTQTVTYADGLRVRVAGIKQGTSTGQGPGVFVGAPQSSVSLEIVNGTTSAVKLDEVVVSMVYGKPMRLAAPVYDQGSRDLSGTVAAGAKVTADYQFSVPVKDLGNVVMTVDIDGSHSVATFSGSARR